MIDREFRNSRLTVDSAFRLKHRPPDRAYLRPDGLAAAERQARNNLNSRTSGHIDTRCFSEHHEQAPIADQCCPGGSRIIIRNVFFIFIFKQC